MKELALYSAISRFGRLNYRAKIMVVAFLGTHIPLLAIIAFYVSSTTSDMAIIWGTLGVGLVATLIGTGITLFVLDQLLKPVLVTSKALRLYRQSRTILVLPREFSDEAGTLMADAGTTLAHLETTLAELEWTDRASGLPNREKFLSLLEMERGGDAPFAVCVVQMRDFGRLLSTYDQTTAEGFVRVLGQRHLEALGPGCALARVEADAIAFIHRGAIASEPGAVSAMLENLLLGAGTTIGLAGISIQPHLSAGVAFFPDDATGPDEMLGLAVAASLMADLRTVSFHSPATRDAAREQFEIEQDLRKAVAGNQFTLAFQPVVDLALGRAVGAEALIRWQHPERGLLLPGAFIPAAERSGVIDEIGLWVMRETLEQAGRWERQGLDPLKIAINLSARQFLDPRLTHLLAEALADTAVSPATLEIELTESVAMADYEHTRRTFGQLRDMGISIAIDDFGTGYASMSYLRKLPFDKLKIDREFVSHVDTQAGAQAICNAMITLSQGLGLRVLAEGVERPEEVDYLGRRGCTLFQGYHFARPVSPSVMAEVLADVRMIAGAGTGATAETMRRSA